MWILLQAEGVLCEVRNEYYVDLLDLKALMSLAPPPSYKFIYTRQEAKI
jgi:hypothetical protein